MPEPTLSIIVPVYRNAASLDALAGRVDAALRSGGTDYRILFVVDACPAGSWDEVQRLTKDNPRAQGLLLEHNHGQHAALMAGLAHLPAPFQAVMDADLQDPPEFLPILLEAARRDDRAAFASRVGAYQSASRMVTSRVFKTIVQAWIGLPRSVGTFFVVPRAVVEDMIALNLPVPQVVVMAWLCAARRTALPCQRAEREHGRSAYTAWGRLREGGRTLVCAWAVYRAKRRQPSFARRRAM